MNKALRTKNEFEKRGIDNYGQKFEEGAEDELMDVGAVDLSDLETDFGIIEDERERKRKQTQVTDNTYSLV